MTDLIARLRGLKWMVHDEMRGLIPDTTAYEAADRIEQLEAQLHQATNEINAMKDALAQCQCNEGAK